MNDNNESEHIRSLSINTRYINNTKIAKKIHEPSVIIDSNLNVDIESGKKCAVKLYNDPNINIQKNNISYYDSIIMDTVYTLLNNGYNFFPIEWIAKVMSANYELRPSQNRIISIINSLNKLRNINISIDCTEQAILRNNKKKKSTLKYTYDGYLLPIELITATYANGMQCTACHVISKPVLYSYAEAINQFITIDIRYYTYNGNETEESIILRHYIITQVAIIKTTRRSPRISLGWTDDSGKKHGLYYELGYLPNNSNTWRKHNKPRIIKIIRSTLSNLVNYGYINGYSEYREHNSNNPAVPIAGFNIYY